MSDILSQEPTHRNNDGLGSELSRGGSTPERETCRDTTESGGAVEVREGLVGAIPKLRAFAMSLCKRSDMADDLVQETMVRAWAKADSYQAGTNLMAWLFTILRNAFYADLRKRKREVEDIDGAHAAGLTTPAAQIPHLETSDFLDALQLLPDVQREAILLVGAAGLTYDEAAGVMGCAIGTVKSRLNRARAELEQILAGDDLSKASRKNL